MKTVISKYFTLATLALLSFSSSAQNGDFFLEYPVVEPSQTAFVEYTCHIQSFGDTRFFYQPYSCGTTGRSLRLEGFSIRRAYGSENIALQYMAHLSGIGDTGWKYLNTYIGTKGESRAMEGFAIRLTGESAKKYDVYYMAHLSGTGDTGWYKNGEFCGTRGQHRNIEAIAVFIADKQ